LTRTPFLFAAYKPPLEYVTECARHFPRRATHPRVVFLCVFEQSVCEREIPHLASPYGYEPVLYGAVLEHDCAHRIVALGALSALDRIFRLSPL